MKISYSWLKEYININLSPEEISKILTSIGLEVEALERIETIKGGLKGVVIGEVLTCQKHPDADKLSVTTVNVGETEPLNIVCGAPNVAAGQKVAVATVGTTLYFNNQELTLKKTKIRGSLSEGMICAEDELGLGTSHDGIMVLDQNAKVGTPAAEYFGVEDDFQLEIGLTPNRIDAASHFGVARDLAAYLNLTQPVKANLPSVENFKIDSKSNHIPVEVVNNEACTRYSGITISNVKVGPSPDWLKNRLRSIGLNPINNIVDVTNYVLHEIGQPLHAFDADEIEGRKVVIKTLPNETAFTTLDEVERKLSNEDLMICNTKDGMCIAGVFGGTKSGVTEKTTNVFLESACFNPVWIRKTAKRHGLSTDASFRFERGSDPNITVWALKRAAMLIKEVAGGEISSDVVDVYINPVEDTPIELSLNYTHRLIGKEIPVDTIKTILESLDIKVKGEEPGKFYVLVPPYRVDVKREADLVEEILRIYGYNNVEFSDKLTGTLSHTDRPGYHKVVGLVSDQLTSMGFNEIMSNSLTRMAYYTDLKTFPAERIAPILNPLSSDLNGMRQTLLFGGLESIAYNINHKNPDLKLYEFGNCYFFDKGKSQPNNSLSAYSEEFMMGIWLCGDDTQENWQQKPKPVSFYTLKSYVYKVFEKLGIDKSVSCKAEAPSDILDYGLTLSIGNKPVAHLGLVSHNICGSLDIKVEVYYAEISWEKVFDVARRNRITYTEIPKYPEVRRDLALLLDNSIHFEQVEKVALAAERKLIKRINLFDVYQGPKLGENKKSYAVSFTLQDENKTLTDKQIDKVMNNLIEAYKKELGAQIR